MGARVLAGGVLAFHFLFVLFSLFGGFLVLWKRWLLWFHLPSVLWSCLVNLLSGVCPLTPLENRFRTLAGEAGYAGGFIEHYLGPLVYPGGMPRRLELVAGFSVLGWNAVVYALVVALSGTSHASGAHRGGPPTGR
ncbi:hypothetical protein GCM10009696_36850 [Kocuria himachalensis]